MYDLPVRAIAGPSELEFNWFPRSDGAAALAFSTASVAGAALTGGDWYVCCATMGCNVVLQQSGASVTADGACHRLPANVPSRRFQCRTTGDKIVVIGDDAGTLHVSKVQPDTRA